MIHCTTTYGKRRRGAFLLALCAMAGAVLSTACGEDTIPDPEALRFGQIGRIVVEMDTPLELGNGHWLQVLTWGSSGAWSLEESISYRGLVGDDDSRRLIDDPTQSVGAYAEVIIQLNDTYGLKLDIPDLPQDEEVECGPGRTHVVFTIQDDAKEDSRTWIACVSGSLATVKTEDAAPAPAASRIAQAVRIVRDATLGQSWTSPYTGSLAFGTLDRGANSGSSLFEPTTITNASDWSTFWLTHAPSRPKPLVDFGTDMVVVAIVGIRQEAGDSLEVHRILPVDNGTQIEIVELVPGDFCSPASLTHVPYHIVVAPKAPRSHRFAAIVRQPVPCGI